MSGHNTEDHRTGRRVQHRPLCHGGPRTCKRMANWQHQRATVASCVPAADLGSYSEEHLECHLGDGVGCFTEVGAALCHTRLGEEIIHDADANVVAPVSHQLRGTMHPHVRNIKRRRSRGHEHFFKLLVHNIDILIIADKLTVRMSTTHSNKQCRTKPSLT